MKIPNNISKTARSWRFSWRVASIIRETERQMDLGTPAGHERYARLSERLNCLVQDYERDSGESVRSQLLILDELQKLAVPRRSHLLISKVTTVLRIVWAGLPWAIAAGLLGAVAVSIGQWVLYLIGLS